MSFGAIAEEGFDEDGFDDEVVEVVVSSAPATKGSLYGSVDLEAHYNFDNDKDLSSLKTLVDVIGEYKLDNGNKIKGNLKGYHDFIYNSGLSNYTTTPNGYKSEVNLNELSIEGSISPKLDFKVGRQVVVWGKSDSIRVTDVLNPIDNRVPGVVDIKNLRLGRVMSKLDYYFDELNLSVIALHENRFTKTAAYGSDFKTTADKATNKPSDSLDNTGVALSLTGAFEGYDLGLYFADTYIDKSYLENDTLQFDNKSKMLGVAYNQVVDSYLFKGEIAYFDQIKYTNVADTKSRTDVLLGFEYSGITDGSLSYEFAYRVIDDYDSNIYAKNNAWKNKREYQQVVRFTQSYLNQTLDLLATLSVFGKDTQDGGSARVSMDYAIDDQTSISGGLIDYLGGDSLALDANKENDRIFVKISRFF
jgi:hypothetical protein